MTTLESPAETETPVRARQQIVLSRYQQTQAGSEKESEIIKQHLPLVKTIAGRLAMTLPPHIGVEDLYSAGMVGLLNAVRQYDPEGGSSFESYARVRIRGAIFDELRAMDWIPRSVHDKARKVQVVMQRLEQILGRTPADGEIARELGVTVEEYEKLMEEIRPAAFVCLDTAQFGGEEDGYSQHEAVADGSQVSPSEQTAKRELARVVADRLEQLPEIQRKVLALYYFEDLRLREIAEVLGVTESRVCQIHAKAILALKSYVQRVESAAAA